MDDDAGGLVDHEQVLVLVGDRELAPAAPAASASGAAVDATRLAAASDVALGPRRAVDAHEPGVDQPLRRRARAGALGQEDVEPLARRLGAATSSSSHARGVPSRT